MAAQPTANEAFFGMPPTYKVVRHVVDFLQWRFSKNLPGGYQWRPEANTLDGAGQSEVFIAADTPIDPVVVGQRPAITVMRSQAAFNGVGINDRAFLDLRTGAEVKMDLLPTTLMINVLSQQPVEAERIAFFLWEQIWIFREAIIAELPALLYLGQRGSFSAPSPAGSLVNSTDHEWSVVTVGMPVYLQHVTTRMPLNRPIMSSITANPSVVSAPSVKGPAPISPLQGTSPSQPTQVGQPTPTTPAVLPQEGGNKAESTGPLTATIKT